MTDLSEFRTAKQASEMRISFALAQEIGRFIKETGEYPEGIYVDLQNIHSIGFEKPIDFTVNAKLKINI